MYLCYYDNMKTKVLIECENASGMHGENCIMQISTYCSFDGDYVKRGGPLTLPTSDAAMLRSALIDSGKFDMEIVFK